MPKRGPAASPTAPTPNAMYDPTRSPPPLLFGAEPASAVCDDAGAAEAAPDAAAPREAGSVGAAAGGKAPGTVFNCSVIVVEPPSFTLKGVRSLPTPLPSACSVCSPGSTGRDKPTSAAGTFAPSMVTVAVAAPSPATLIVTLASRGS